MRAIRLKVCISFNISSAPRATNVPKFIIDCEFYSVNDYICSCAVQAIPWEVAERENDTRLILQVHIRAVHGRRHADAEAQGLPRRRRAP